jgi:N-acetylneuraminic acid mutarotase
LLQNGKVLVVGGYNRSAITPTAELYDPATGTWSLTGILNVPRSGHSVTLLSNGKVLFAGGARDFSPTNTAELYDPLSGTWSLTGNLNVARLAHTAAVLRDGRVLVAGGCGPNCVFDEELLSSAELYDPNTGAWSYTGSLNGPVNDSVTITLPNGNVLVAGGADPFATNRAELYDPATGRWSYTGSLLSRRFDATATMLPSGQVLVVGGKVMTLTVLAPTTF